MSLGKYHFDIEDLFSPCRRLIQLTEKTLTNGFQFLDDKYHITRRLDRLGTHTRDVNVTTVDGRERGHSKYCDLSCEAKTELSYSIPRLMVAHCERGCARTCV
jgi:hypothetical protein